MEAEHTPRREQLRAADADTEAALAGDGAGGGAGGEINSHLVSWDRRHVWARQQASALSAERQNQSPTQLEDGKRRTRRNQTDKERSSRDAKER